MPRQIIQSDGIFSAKNVKHFLKIIPVFFVGFFSLTLSARRGSLLHAAGLRPGLLPRRWARARRPVGTGCPGSAT